MQAADQPQSQQTYVIDAESAAEMSRLLEQDRLLTSHLGGLLPERTDLAPMQWVLDLACGPGGWAQAVALARAAAGMPARHSPGRHHPPDRVRE
jgi:hypothetical protein